MKNVLFALALASFIMAASAQPASDALIACSHLKDTGERVRCYDTQVAAMKQGAAPAPEASGATAAGAAAEARPPAVSAAAPPMAAPVSPQAVKAVAAPSQSKGPAEFGADDLPLAMRAPQPQEDRVLSSSIKAMRTVGYETYLISLANGQVWNQQGSHITAFFHVGDDVRIEKGALGSYHMSTKQAGQKNWVRVTRVQ